MAASRLLQAETWSTASARVQARAGVRCVTSAARRLARRARPLRDVAAACRDETAPPILHMLAPRTGQAGRARGSRRRATSSSDPPTMP